ncbi:acyltransferase family-domain-containing protein [Podospora aff. communis PSN243]|uniref:Acyltransferase family-domain-containing protein n=1 Tax=Podospora aff. communis PSN243 TaxID=3040156 RepID=A0AAV9GJY1_9PEZI|nr:acyltransferase family-domain-containing protein [Podospora aff. communis PSN243]
MNNYADSAHTLHYEESAPFLDEEKTPSDIESDAGRADLTTRFPPSLPRRLRAVLLRTTLFLLPSFLHPNQPPRPKPSPTAYLDGIRGIAALVVFICHLTYTCFVIAPGYGYRNSHHHILALPFLRLLYSGPPMVCLFFVVSGYALSYKPLRLIHAQSYSDLATTLSSLIFRRGIRLFLPCVVSTLLIVFLLRVGAYEWNREFAYDYKYSRNIQEIHYERFDSTAEQLVDWGRAMWKFVHVWDWDEYGGSTAMDVHLWTIPVEFRASMVVFLAVLACAKARVLVRVGVLMALGVFAYCSARWEVMLFCWGVGMAERDVLSRGERGKGKGMGVVWGVVSVVGMYLLSQPDVGGDETPGWVWLEGVIPEWWEDKHRYYQSFGAMVFVMAVGRSNGWQRVFNSGVVQYFGRISYGLYLMHGPVMHTLGYTIEKWVWGMTGIEGAAYYWGFALASLLVIPTVVWVSDIFSRAVDAPVVRFSKWVEMKCCLP